MKMANSLSISLGNPVTAPFCVPVKHDATSACINNPFMVNGECHYVTAMSFGTPHGAVFVDDVDDIDVPALGLALGTHTLFPQGASIVFVQTIDDENIKSRLWHREQGETMFTPEAVCVAAVASIMLQKIVLHTAIVTMGGSIFQVQWNRGVGDVILTGPAFLVS